MSIEQQSLTFAGICQSAAMVQGIARKNQLDDQQFVVMLQSIINTNPSDAIDVYGGQFDNIQQGLSLIVTQLGDGSVQKDPEITRYIVSLLNLERRLQGKPKIMAELGNRIEQCQRQLQHYDINSDTMLNAFASIYSDLISPLATRIQIAGEPNILKQVGNQHRIRALLLAGIRSAVLWRQVGGKRRNILFGRRKFVSAAQQLLKNEP
ncbi:high frequency lysogenization protein HflD [Thalassotalea sp. HSM 43]|uniref:high frequency lysogenization protein HflD n=1 Tax=Thalassotalea sp. HSM 43 TaxID=2552945 RepID=UPI001080AE8E|nr:high frequency lysogenization protein HflD [Thalassotalea sp. HSM 43]QBY05949.1 high frequency lysogenization protein HflD [Thalassotalea sp. HSM 43]